MTWEQFTDLQRFSVEEPWGETRADMRAAVNTLWAAGGDDRPDLIWPYFPDRGDIKSQVKELERQKREMTDEHKQKIKESKEKYLKEHGR